MYTMTTTNPATKSVEENVASLATVCHVVETKAPYALVHASPNGLAAIVGMGFPVAPAKRGAEYYAVKVGRVMSAPQGRLSLVPPAPVVAPQVPVVVAPQAPTGPAHMNIGGTDYIVRETPCKRRIDVRRWEVRKVGEEVSAPYVVTFQAEDGSKTACSCKGGIFHKHCKHMDTMRSVYGKRDAANVA